MHVWNCANACTISNLTLVIFSGRYLISWPLLWIVHSCSGGRPDTTSFMALFTELFSFPFGRTSSPSFKKFSIFRKTQQETRAPTWQQVTSGKDFLNQNIKIDIKYFMSGSNSSKIRGSSVSRVLNTIFCLSSIDISRIWISPGIFFLQTLNILWHATLEPVSFLSYSSTIVFSKSLSNILYKTCLIDREQWYDDGRPKSSGWDERNTLLDVRIVIKIPEMRHFLWLDTNHSGKRRRNCASRRFSSSSE